MTCVLRLNGSKSSVKLLLENSSLTPDNVFEEGLTLLVSDGSLHDLEGQIQDAILYLKKNGKEIGKLCNRFGIEGRCLDFAIAQSD